MLHALQKVLVMGDVQHQDQLRGAGLLGIQRRVVHPVAGAGALQAVQAGRSGQVIWDAQRAVKPALAVGGIDAHRQVGLMAQLVFQCGDAWGEQRRGVGALQGAAQGHQLAVEQLLVQLEEVFLAGLVEQHARQQRDHGGAAGKQQGQAAGQGQALDQLNRSSST